MALDKQSVQPPIHQLDKKPCSIGRSDRCTIRVVRDGVSRYHAVIGCDHDVYHITDQRSSWGTFVNGERIVPMEPYRLSTDALIGLGSPQPILRFCDPDSTLPPPEPPVRSISCLLHDAARQRFLLYDRPLELPFLAYRLLHHLNLHQGAICRPSSCINAVWEIDEASADELANRLYRLINELRELLDAHQQPIAPQRRVRIESYRRRGYALVVPDNGTEGL